MNQDIEICSKVLRQYIVDGKLKKTNLKKFIKQRIKETKWDRHVFLIDVYLNDDNFICAHFQSSYFNDFFINLESGETISKTTIGSMNYQLDFVFNTNRFNTPNNSQIKFAQPK